MWYRAVLLLLITCFFLFGLHVVNKNNELGKQKEQDKRKIQNGEEKEINYDVIETKSNDVEIDNDYVVEE